ncbi:hypothetical protein Scep_003905 [Stephania cephalantha]|uniref:RNA-directed DNA polymerase, eukaryota, reverse transcriptase zinc-binding domain protein n=1 Tax=Stephania cephalantha TaxID=152367 RepID=A0AAP0PYI1_9MAGN
MGKIAHGSTRSGNFGIARPKPNVSSRWFRPTLYRMSRSFGADTTAQSTLALTPRDVGKMVTDFDHLDNTCLCLRINVRIAKIDKTERNRLNRKEAFRGLIVFIGYMCGMMNTVLNKAEAEGNWDDVKRIQRDELKTRLAEALINENRMPRQKAKLRWLKEGDANTKYFHPMMSCRKNKNYIGILQDDNGVFTEDEASIKLMILKFYTKLYSSEGHTN